MQWPVLTQVGSGDWQAFLDKTRQKVTLSEKIQLSHDTYIYRFALSKKNMMLGLPVGKHFKVCMHIAAAAAAARPQSRHPAPLRAVIFPS